MNNFYVYAYCYPDAVISDGVCYYKPFYIGKGQHDRIYTHIKKIKAGKCTHNLLFSRIINKLLSQNLEPIVCKIYEQLNELDSYIFEHETINKYGRIAIDDNGILSNRTIGLEHFNINLNQDIRVQLKLKLDASHGNSKPNSKLLISEICNLYAVDNWSFNMLYDKYRISKARIRKILVDNNVHIKTKSESRIGNKNPMFGIKRPPNNYFGGHTHTTESKLKISNSLKNKC
jgi:hypothetical protein